MNHDVAVLTEVTNNLTETAKRLTLLANTVDRNTGATVSEFREAVKLLTQTVAALRNDVTQLMEAVSNRVEKSVGRSIDTALEPSTAKYNQAVNAATNTLTGAGREFVELLNTALAPLRRQVWLGLVIVAGTMALLIGGGSLLLWFQQQSYSDARARTAAAQVDAETMEAFAHAGMASCGGRPCLKLDLKSPRWGSKGEYILLDTMPKPKTSTAKN